MSPAVVIEDATCLGCGCACDDIDVVVDDGRIVDARNACALGAAWFGDGHAPARSLVRGRITTVEEALSAAIELLIGARRVLVYLAPGLSCEAQRAGTAIADVLGGLLDSATTATALSTVLASQESGQATATLGEIRNRADVVVFWAVDIDGRYPRFASRYAPQPPGAHVPGGRASRTVIAVDVGQATAPSDADRRIAVDPADELATLTALQALSASSERRDRLAELQGAAWENARGMAPALLGARYVALVYDAEPDERSQRSGARFDALAALGRALNDATRCAAIALRAGGNRSGADATLTAQVGYPLAVDFARGHPRYRPHDGSALICLDRGDVDVALVLGTPALVPLPITTALATVACVLIGPSASESSLGPHTIAIDAGVPGIHSPGTALRTDDVPLPLRPSLPGPPSAEALVTRLAGELSTRTHRGGA